MTNYLVTSFIGIVIVTTSNKGDDH